ncbi:MAG: carbohydrate-binding domain-containing protein [Lachnospiraceae bacterium]|nr:carbohydrate-binding domain-containing protein [Lachnospiraceae bacterium]
MSCRGRNLGGKAIAILFTIVVLCSSVVFFGCEKSSDDAATKSNGNETDNTSSNNMSSNNKGNEIINIGEMFTGRDKEIGYDEEKAVLINLNESKIECASSLVDIKDNVATIKGEGTFILSGKLSDGQIIVEASDTDKLQIVLDNADITCNSSAAIYIRSADKVFVTLANGSDNLLTSKGKFINIDDNNIDGVIFSKCDLTLNGAGTLTVSCENAHGIVSKKDLKITSGEYNITAAVHALSGKNSIRIADGTFNFVCNGDGLHADNEDDVKKGYIYVEGGSFEISSDDDGMSASSALMINGGNVNITKCNEGLEGMYIDINAGNISIVSGDDGINASGGNSNSNSMKGDSSLYISIAGGVTYVNAGGDGIDSNGNIYISGGELYISGPTNSANGAIDYELEGIITGGTVVAAGSAGMAENFSSGSAQGSMLVNISGMVTGEIIIKNSAGEVLARFTPDKSYNSVVISTPDIKVGETYTVSMAGEETTVNMESTIYGSGFGNPGGFGNGGDRNGGNMGNGDNRGNKPHDMKMLDGMEFPDREEIFH